MVSTFSHNRILSLVGTTLLAAVVLFLPFVLFAAEDQPDVDPNIWQRLVLWIGNVIISTAAAITWGSGMLFDLALKYLVIDFGTNIRSTGIGNAINDVWTIIRDIMNLAFIFGFIYIGIKTILVPGSADTKRFLTQLIIAALLINFSLFFTKVITDVANVFAVEIYSSLFAPGQQNASLGTTFAEGIGITGLYDSALNQEMFDNLTAGASFWFFVLGSIFLLVAAFVLLAGAFMLAVRFAGLVLIMIFSPILFAATIFPQTQKYSSMLWNKLLSYAFFAPAYLLLLFVSLKVMGAGGTSGQGFLSGNGETLAGAIQAGFQQNAPAESYEVILRFVLMIIFLILALVAAKQFGMHGADATIRVGNNLRGWAQGKAGRGVMRLTSRPLRKAADKTHARMSRRLDNMKWYNPTKWAGAGVAGVVSGTADTLREGEKKMKFGSAESIEDVEKRKMERSKRDSSLNALADLKAALRNGDEATIERAMRRMTKARFEEAGADLLNDEKVMRFVSNKQMEEIDKIDSFTDAQKEELRKTRGKAIISLLSDDKGNLVPDKIRKASVAQLEATGLEFLKREEVAGSLATNQLDDLRKSKEVIEADIGDIERRRKDYFDRIKSDPAALKAEVQGRKPKDAAKLPADILTNAANADPKNISVEVFHQMIDQKVDRTTQQAVYSELKKQRQNLSQEMRGYLETDFVQGRFEPRRGGGGGQQGGGGQNPPQGGGGQSGGQQGGGWTKNPPPGIGGGNQGGNQNP